MGIGNIDVQTSKTLSKRFARNVSSSKRIATNKGAGSDEAGHSTSGIRHRPKTTESSGESSEVIESGSTSGSDFEQPRSARPVTKHNLKRICIRNTAQAAYRTGASDRQVAMIASAALQDAGVISPEDKSCVIDRSKVRRGKDKLGDDIRKEESLLDRGITSIYFDGKEDTTLVQEKINNKLHRREVKEKHISVLSEPNSEYLCHVTPKSGSGKDIASSIVDNLRKNQYDLSELEAVGYDGERTNTGCNNGAIAWIERLTNKELQHLICLLHTNELPLRHLGTHLDGATKSPDSFSGPIGQKLLLHYSTFVGCYPFGTAHISGKSF